MAALLEAAAVVTPAQAGRVEKGSKSAKRAQKKMAAAAAAARAEESDDGETSSEERPARTWHTDAAAELEAAEAGEAAEAAEAAPPAAAGRQRDRRKARQPHESGGWVALTPAQWSPGRAVRVTRRTRKGQLVDRWCATLTHRLTDSRRGLLVDVIPDETPHRTRQVRLAECNVDGVDRDLQRTAVLGKLLLSGDLVRLEDWLLACPQGINRLVHDGCWRLHGGAEVYAHTVLFRHLFDADGLHGRGVPARSQSASAMTQALLEYRGTDVNGAGYPEHKDVPVSCMCGAVHEEPYRPLVMVLEELQAHADVVTRLETRVAARKDAKDWLEMALSRMEQSRALFADLCAHPSARFDLPSLTTNWVRPPAVTQTITPPLHLAASRGWVPEVECLLRNGADPNHRDCLGRTPAELTDSPMILTLLERHREWTMESHGYWGRAHARRCALIVAIIWYRKGCLKGVVPKLPMATAVRVLEYYSSRRTRLVGSFHR
eukprot:TRINITY_DN6185_c0_g2_i1.p1 TRINITY_DN6185_c0_g2~~TRINITY_DN6185_c0_g2_i1.p1  ORF type:complete len:510 (+),score=170.63 TRINITY_DN6185_c0_g2_i1:62-1531(+)